MAEPRVQGSESQPGAHDVVARKMAEPRAEGSEPPSTLRPIPSLRPSPLASRGPRRLRRYVPLALAASAVAAIGLWSLLVPRPTPRPLFPESPLLRGAAGGPLFYPRDRVLVPSEAVRRTWPTLGQALTFEIEPQPEASLYRIELSRTDGGAFARSEPIADLTSPAPSDAGGTVRVTASAPLPPGHYTWEAWTVVHGLDHRLAARDF